jgi:signal-transduction protein with cAMP-binding, CBS, and nucleotidyltransferase domain
MGKFFLKYKFFREFKKNQTSPDGYLNLVKHIRILAYEKDQIMIEQGEVGDRFYILLKGKVSVFRSSAHPVHNIDSQDSAENIVSKYLLALSKNCEHVMWSKVPYCSKVNKSITDFMQWNDKGGEAISSKET